MVGAVNHFANERSLLHTCNEREERGKKELKDPSSSSAVSASAPAQRTPLLPSPPQKTKKERQKWYNYAMHHELLVWALFRGSTVYH